MQTMSPAGYTQRTYWGRLRRMLPSGGAKGDGERAAAVASSPEPVPASEDVIEAGNRDVGSSLSGEPEPAQPGAEAVPGGRRCC